MATEQLEGAFRYLTRTAQPNASALRALDADELRTLKLMFRERGVPVAPTVGRAIDSLIVERRGERRSRSDAPPPRPEPLAKSSGTLWWILVLPLAVTFAMLLVRLNRWP